MNKHIKQWVIGISGVIGLVYGLMLFGDAFRAYTLPFALLWIAVPIFACFLGRRSISACFTLAGLRRLQTTLMIVVVALSFGTFAAWDHVRNQFGRHFVQGYRYWRAEPDVDDNGQMYYPGDGWTAKNRSGRWGVELFGLAVLVGVFALPALTLWATRYAIYKKKAQCVFTSDGNGFKLVETYETSA
jgi:hypothetical protein